MGEITKLNTLMNTNTPVECTHDTTCRVKASNHIVLHNRAKLSRMTSISA